ncbi:NrsF family protein [Neorhizobium sp. NCHU2750]|uniref:NrsF family protein n=1 Tax=Neorhizobium sp. NCHU2750 TaxID=1825976 RepID=UPI000EB73B4A|nr:membrane protein [Neorhizobium sp. NCHU2750]
MMNNSTDDIIDRLVADLKPVPRHALIYRFALGLAPALILGLLVLVLFIGFRRDMPHALVLPVFWIKSAYNAALAIIGFVAVFRLSRPGASPGRPAGNALPAMALVVVVMAVIAVIQLAISPAAAYRILILGSSALHCPFVIIGFGLPFLLAYSWSLKAGAPTNPRLTGFAAGLAAGAAGAWVYSWFCNENGMPFVLIWYSLGILLSALIGMVIAPRIFRW